MQRSVINIDLDRRELYSKLRHSTFRGSCLIEAPSNIAIVKYWGKRPIQLPQNPSLSFSLQASKTIMRLDWKVIESLEAPFCFDLEFNGQSNIKFEERMRSYLKSIETFFPLATLLDYRVHVQNTFPHSAGIASSASSFAALALGLVYILQQLNNDTKKDNNCNCLQKDYLQEASILARYGSGSACRSVYPYFALWGRHPYIPSGCDDYAINIKEGIHQDFLSIKDAILIVDSSPKEISSSKGHELMERHPYASARYKQASENVEILMNALTTGDWSKFGMVCESEALSLHALMASSQEPYILMKPATLEVITKIRHFRQEKKIPLYFTLDAGPNIHLLYPAKVEDQIREFIIQSLIPLLENGAWIDDSIGEGPKCESRTQN